VLFYWPLAHVLNNGLIGSWWLTLTEPTVVDSIWFTVWQAFASTMLCLLLGLPMAYVLYRRRVFGSFFWRALLTVPFALPTIITAIGFTVFQNRNNGHSEYGMYSVSWLDQVLGSPVFWIIVAHLFVNLSVVIRTVGATWANLSFDTEEAAALGGAGRFRIFWSVSLPQLRPAIISATATVFLYCSASYGLILVLGGGLVNSIETEIASAALVRLDLAEAGALSLIQTLLSVLAFWISSLGGRSAIGFDIHEVSDRQPRVDRRDWPVLLATVFGIALVIAPLALILLRAFVNAAGQPTLANFADLGGTGARGLLNITLGQAALNTLRNVLVAIAFATVIGVQVAYLLSRRHRERWIIRLQRLLDILFLMPLGVSTIVLGLGYLMTFGSGWLPLRSSWVVVPLIQGLMAIPLVVRIVYPAMVTASEELAEQASTDGASAAATFWNVELPMIRLTIGAAIGYAAIVSVGEFGAANLLAYGSQATLPTVLYQLVSRPGGNNYGMAMAMSAIVIALTFVVVLAASWQRRTAPRRQPRRA
jgi:thiamine transport system permease protein